MADKTISPIIDAAVCAAILGTYKTVIDILKDYPKDVVIATLEERVESMEKDGQ